MDCEKFEPLLLDELYEELDELTSAAVKRHVSGCARCGAVLADLRATRRAVSLPLVPVPEGLEDRILAAAREAQKVVPIRSRASRFLGWAGSWAMRPQTAMAAVFLLMIGSGAFLIRSRTYESSRAASVSGYGSPAPQAEPAAVATTALDDKAADTAHGPAVPPPVAVAPPPPAPSVAVNDPSAGPMDDLTGGAARGKKDGDEPAGGALGLLSSGEGTKEERKARPKMALPSNAGAPGGTSYDEPGTQRAEAPMPTTRARSGPAQQDPFSQGVAAYQARNYAEATRQFDLAAQTGDRNAALWAAKSVRESSGGCAAALPRFDRIAQSGAGTWHGDEASLEAARCQMAMGNYAAARERLVKLAQSSTHASKAQAALDEMNQMAAKNKSGGGSGGHAPAAPRAAAPAPPAKPAGDHGSGKASEKRPADAEQHQQRHGF